VIRKVLILFLIRNKYSPYAIPWPDGESAASLVAQKQSFLLLTHPSLFIFCLRPPLAWAVRWTASLQRYHTKRRSTTPMKLHSLIPLCLYY